MGKITDALKKIEQERKEEFADASKKEEPAKAQPARPLPVKISPTNVLAPTAKISPGISAGNTSAKTSIVAFATMFLIIAGLSCALFIGHNASVSQKREMTWQLEKLKVMVDDNARNLGSFTSKMKDLAQSSVSLKRDYENVSVKLSRIELYAHDKVSQIESLSYGKKDVTERIRNLENNFKQLTAQVRDINAQVLEQSREHLVATRAEE